MTNRHGDFIWYELLTRDAGRAADFYGKVLGWTTRRFGEGMPYTLASAPDADVAGIMALGDCPDGGEGMEPGWLGYIGVDDVDRTAGELAADGARQYVPPTDIPGVGRFAMFADPQGAAFYIMRGASEGTSTAFDLSAKGHCNWNELLVPDPETGLAFFARHFGWERGDAMPMGDEGDYRFIDHGGRTIGATMPNMQGGPRLRFYFGVPDIGAAERAVRDNGGSVLVSPVEIPGGEYVMVAADPDGASFGMVGPKGAT